MKGICPTCGASGSIEFFASEAIARQTLASALALPKAVQDSLFGYLALFRPKSGGAIQPRKALRLMQEIAALIAPGYIQVKGQPARPCPARIWAEAMTQISERRDSLRLPLASHQYMAKIAWDLADREDARVEATRNEEALSGNHRAPSSGPRPPSPGGRRIADPPLPPGEGRGEGEVDDGLLPVERAILAKGGTLKRME